MKSFIKGGVALLKAFREFALKGSVVDLAVGVIIGAQFNNVINSLVNDIIMPPLGLLINRVQFSNLYIAIWGPHAGPTPADAQKAGAVTINYGTFLQTVVNFLLVAFVLFLIIQQINRLRRQPKPETHTKKCPFCMTQIDEDATRCPACTSQLSTEKPAEKPA